MNEFWLSLEYEKSTMKLVNVDWESSKHGLNAQYLNIHHKRTIDPNVKMYHSKSFLVKTHNIQ